ncbi:MAG: T9SS type A sorting domain-containing protein [Saprospiraceae bacterium]
MKKIHFLLFFHFLAYSFSSSGQKLETCTLNAGVNVSYCNNIFSFQLDGSASSTGFESFNWQLLSGPTPVNIMPNNQVVASVTPSIPGGFGVGDYTFQLSGYCKVDEKLTLITQTVVVTIWDGSELDIMPSNDYPFEIIGTDQYQGCKELILTPILPEGFNGNWAWTWTPDDDLEIHAAASGDNLLVYGSSNKFICDKILTATLTLYDDGNINCIFSKDVAINLLGTQTGYSPTTEQDICDDYTIVSLPYPGCDIDWSYTYSSTASGTPTPPIFSEFTDGRLKATFVDLEEGHQYIFNFFSTETSICEPVNKTFTFNVFGEFDPVHFPITRFILCENTPQNILIDLTDDLVGYNATINWQVNLRDVNGPLNPIIGNTPVISFTPPPNTYFNIDIDIDDIDSPCDDDQFLTYYVDNDYNIPQEPLILDCTEEDVLVKFNQHISAIYDDNFANGIDVDIHFLGLTPNNTNYDIGWGSDNKTPFNPFTSFFATSSGTYQFQLRTTMEFNGQPSCNNSSEIFTVIVAPGGVIANAGTDFPPTCVKSTQLVGNDPMMTGLAVEWNVVQGSNVMWINGNNNIIQDVEGLLEEIYIFEYRIYDLEDPSCFSVSYVTLDNTNCEDDCPVLDDLDYETVSSKGIFCINQEDDGTITYFLNLKIQKDEYDGMEFCSLNPNLLEVTNGVLEDPFVETQSGGNEIRIYANLIVDQSTNPEDVCITFPVCIEEMECFATVCLDEWEECDLCDFDIEVDDIDLNPSTDTDCPPGNNDDFDVYDVSNLTVTITNDNPNWQDGHIIKVRINQYGTGHACIPTSVINEVWSTNPNSISVTFPPFVWNSYEYPFFCFTVVVKNKDLDEECEEIFCYTIEELEMLIGKGGEESFLNINLDEGIALQNPNLKVYPNPTSNWITLDNSFDVKYQIELYSILGDKILDSKIEPNSQQRIDLRNISQGVYLLKYQNMETLEVNSQKIIIH